MGRSMQQPFRKHQLDSRIDMRSYKEQGIDKEPEKKLLPSQAKNPEIREALQQSRTAHKELVGLDLGDPKKTSKTSKTAQFQTKKLNKVLRALRLILIASNSLLWNSTKNSRN